MKLTQLLKSEREEILDIVIDISKELSYEKVKHLEKSLYMFNDKAKEEAVKQEQLKLFPTFFKKELIKQIISNNTSFKLNENIDFIFEVKWFGWNQDITDTFDKYCSVK